MSAPLPDRPHPAMAGYAEAVPLSGFSGAQVTLLRTPGGSHFVRKAAWDAGVGATLRKQAARQRWLGGALAGAARVPAVLDEGEVDGLFYFDMAFVPSRDALSFLSSAPFDRLAGFAGRVEALMAMLAELAPDPASARVPTAQALLAKLDEIALKTDGRHALALDPLRRAALLIGTLTAAHPTPATAGHGDLTFENILVARDETLWLIDPIESPIDHYWIDWSKLFQECEGLWHVHRGRPVAQGVMRWLRNRWFDAAVRLAPDYADRHYLLLGLTFARILPYARSDADRAFVAERVERYGAAALAAARTTAGKSAK